MDRKRAGILLFNDIEVLDFCGPFEVFSATRLNEARRREESSPFDVALVTEDPAPIVTAGGMTVSAGYVLENCPPLDVLVVPGGWGTRQQLDNPVILEWLRRQAAQVEVLSAVCTGSMLLGCTGLLDGHRATTHWRALDWMRDSFPSVAVEYDKHFVEDGYLWTSAGISAGIDMALRIVARYCGEDIARATARHMEYPYPETDARRVPISAQSGAADAPFLPRR